jgi:CubicO group peptidase (beta-lactamase class C family)
MAAARPPRTRSPLSLSLLLAALVPGLFPQGATAQASPLDGLDGYVTSAMKDWAVPGLAIAVVKGDSVIFAKGYGVRERGTQDGVDANTLFAIASTSKAFTAAALGMLVDEGKVTWDDPVTTHLPAFEVADPYVTREMTVRDLLTHRGGLARDDNLWIAAPFDRDEILRHLRWLPQASSFRSRYGYNNLAFITAGEVAGRASGMGWDDFVQRRIFDPLGMARSTSRAAVVDARENVSSGHDDVDGVVRAVPRRNYDNIGGAGAIWSSAADMAQWLRMQVAGGTFGGHRLLSDSVIAEMRTPQTIMRLDSVDHRLFPDTHFQAYGFGWNVQDYHGRLLVHHSGSINYTRTQVGFIPSEGIGVVAVANLSTSTLQLALMYRVLDALLGARATDWSAKYLELAERSRARAAERAEVLEASRLEGTSPSLPLHAYTGEYESDLWGTLEVTEGDGRLVIAYSPAFVADLEHWHHDIFRGTWRRAGDGRTFVTFTLDERAHITAVHVEDLGTFRRTDRGEG